MRKLAFITAFVFCMTAGLAGAKDSPWETRLPFKKGTIQYNITGSQTGTETLYIKDYGRTTARHRTVSMKFLGMTQTTKEIEITTPEWVYNVDLTEQTCEKSTNPTKYMIEEFNKLSKKDRKKVIKNSLELGTQMIEGMSGTIQVKGAKVLGYPCDVVTVMGTKTYCFTGTSIVLKSEANLMGMKITSTATGIQKGAPASAHFQVPQGIQVHHNTQGDEMIKEMARTTIQNLLLGKTAAPQANDQQRFNAIQEDQKNDPEGDMPDMQKMMELMKQFGQEN
ncbi:MAG: hypothetical protein GY737_00560 [Desulfobacteraceae bacterium]|nr:hypothetical protein [Desulfobacteraceae bacterium]